MSLHCEFPFASVCDYDFFAMTGAEDEWNPQIKIPEFCCGIQEVHYPGAILYELYHLACRVYVTSTGEYVPRVFPLPDYQRNKMRLFTEREMHE